MKKSSLSWILLLAIRFLNSKRSSFWILLISIVGIVLGIAILLVIMSIMNGSQLIFYENSQEILSYHIQIECGSDYDEVINFTKTIQENVSGATVVQPYFETQGMLVNENGKQLFIGSLKALPFRMLSSLSNSGLCIMEN